MVLVIKWDGRSIPPHVKLKNRRPSPRRMAWLKGKISIPVMVMLTHSNSQTPTPFGFPMILGFVEFASYRTYIRQAQRFIREQSIHWSAKPMKANGRKRLDVLCIRSPPTAVQHGRRRVKFLE